MVAFRAPRGLSFGTQRRSEFHAGGRLVGRFSDMTMWTTASAAVAHLAHADMRQDTSNRLSASGVRVLFRVCRFASFV